MTSSFLTEQIPCPFFPPGHKDDAFFVIGEVKTRGKRKVKKLYLAPRTFTRVYGTSNVFFSGRTSLFPRVINVCSWIIEILYSIIIPAKAQTWVIPCILQHSIVLNLPKSRLFVFDELSNLKLIHNSNLMNSDYWFVIIWSLRSRERFKATKYERGKKRSPRSDQISSYDEAIVQALSYRF